MAENERRKRLLEGVELAPVRETPLTATERLIVQNIFDTQPLKREQYLKEIGFEMDPEDTNRVRPLGSLGQYDIEIDPGISAMFKAGGLAEIAKDLGDVAFDTLVASPLTAIGAAGAGVAGTAAAAPTGPAAPVFGFLSAVLGGSVGNKQAEELKNTLADLYTDKDIPLDQRDLFAQSLLSGTMEATLPLIGRGVKTTLKKLDIADRLASMKAAFSAGGGLKNPEILEAAAKNPERFAPEAVAGARQKLDETFRDLVGVADDQLIRRIREDVDSPLPNGRIAKILSPLKSEQQKAYKMLAADPQANIKLSDAIEAMKGRFAQAAETSPLSLPLPVRDARDKIKNITAEFLKAKGVQISGKELKAASLEDLVKKAQGVDLNYVEMRNFVSRLQEESFDQATRSENGFLKGLARDGRVLADQVAEQASKANPEIPNIPQINQRMSKLLTAYSNFAESATPDRLFLAEKQGFMATSDQLTAQEALRTLAEEMKTPELANEFKDIAQQAWFDQLYRAPLFEGAQLSSGRTAGAVSGAKRGLVGGLAAGTAVGLPLGVVVPGATPVVAGVTALGGGIKGALEGANKAALLSTPAKIVPELISINQTASQADELARQLARGSGQATDLNTLLNQVVNLAPVRSSTVGQETMPAEARAEERRAQRIRALYEGIDE